MVVWCGIYLCKECHDAGFHASQQPTHQSQPNSSLAIDSEGEAESSAVSCDRMTTRLSLLLFPNNLVIISSI